MGRKLRLAMPSNGASPSSNDRSTRITGGPPPAAGLPGGLSMSTPETIGPGGRRVSLLPRWRTWLAVTVGLSAGVFLTYVASSSVSYIHWVRFRDLEITFRFLDADSNEPVQGAKVNVLHSWPAPCQEDQKPPLCLDAGDDGAVRYLAKQCMCFGTEGGWGPTRKDTFESHIPSWLLTVEAPGYTTTDPVELETLRTGHRMERGKEKDLLEIVVKLEKRRGPVQPGADERGGK
jgi:hypothetical protein